jgi:hypothetical protein
MSQRVGFCSSVLHFMVPIFLSRAADPFGIVTRSTADLGQGPRGPSLG